MAPQRNCCELEVLDLHFSDPQRRFCHLYLQSPGWNYTVGQFVMLKAASFGLELPLGRPLSICELNTDCLHLFFQVQGKGTKRLAEMSSGDEVTVWGPLGNGFCYSDKQPLLLLAGGIGIAPFFQMARVHPQPELLNLVFGHQVEPACYSLDIFSRLGRCQFFHQRGPEELTVFIQLLEKEMAGAALENRLVLACGPLPFLETVQRLAAQYQVATQISLETRMGCGIGACLGCMVEGREQRLPTCTCGPVFEAHEVRL